PAPGSSPSASAADPAPRRAPVAPEDDMAEEDDPDLDESALSGHELIVRELGATVMEEFSNE
ncbi:DNA polymerase III subunit gamma/tau, partial [Streptomyces griseoaurantiacus]